jgi:hypothetical protein
MEIPEQIGWCGSLPASEYLCYLRDVRRAGLCAQFSASEIHFIDGGSLALG